MQALLRDGRDLAAASPLLASAAPGNVGTAAVASLRVTESPLPMAGASTRISFTSDAGDYNWEVFDSGNNLLAAGSGLWQPGQTIPASGVSVNGFELTLSGVPRNGDVLNVEPTPVQALASNNGNAVALLALRDAAIVGGRSATDAWSYTMADIGVRVQTARTSAEISDAVAGTAELRRSSQSGVNLDEEAARLIQYQQSYQAAAKVLQVAQSLFDTLLQTAGG
jgi:flagellar hook-associated protein 1 FlgK